MAPAPVLSSPYPAPPAWDPNFGHLNILNDVLYPKGATGYVGLDRNIRIALFILTQAIPPISAVLVLLSQKGFWKPKYHWSFSRLVILWLFSVQIFGAIVYAQKGATTRVLFLAGALHLQIEYLLISLLLKASALQALFFAWLGGTILYSIQLFVTDLSVVYFVTTIAGASDFLIPIMLAYGHSWLFAIGGFAHLASAISVFCVVVKNYGHIQFDVLTWLTIWIMNSALVAGLLIANRKQKALGAIRLEGESEHNDHEHVQSVGGGEAFDNPLSDIDWWAKKKELAIMVGVSVVGSVVSAFLFTFVVAR